MKLGYVTIGVKDIEKGKAFWAALLEPLGARELKDAGRVVFIGDDPANPMLAVCSPYNEQEPHSGNGNMLAFAVGSQANVDALHQRAMELGAFDEGAPGDRGGDFYGGYIRDPDGNKAAFFHFVGSF